MESGAQSIVANAVQLLNAEYQQLRGVGVKVVHLSDDLAAMNAVLRMLSEADEGAVDHLVREWEKQLRELAYDTRDCVDLYKLRIKSSPNGGLSTRMKHLLSTLFARRQLAGEIDALRARASAISERHARFGVYHTLLHRSPSRLPAPRSAFASANNDVENKMAAIWMARSPQLIQTPDPVGVEDMNKLRPWIEKEDKDSDPAVISIVGCGGVGKTTIATALYRDFSNKFDFQASVTVSQNYDEDQVLRDILGQIKQLDREQEQQDRNTGINRGLAKRLVALLLSGRREQGSDSSTPRVNNNVELMTRDQLIEVKQRDREQDQQDRNTGTPEKGFVKRVVPLRGHKNQGNDANPLIQELQSYLEGKRYILLIDDVWSVETWEKIRKWLPHEKGSKVIVTSRFHGVGAACSERDGTHYLHTVNFLSDNAMSESLFNQAVSESQRNKYSVSVTARSQAVGMEYSKGNGTDSNLYPAGVFSDTNAKDPLIGLVSDPQSSNSGEKEKVHEEIWKYCGGLPLAIVTMAGLVACNPSKSNDHWSQVCKSLFTGQVAPLTLDGVTRILDYCYNDLPPDLKTLSLFLSIFPKGSKISKKRLIRRWISECLVTEKQGLSAEEVAETYFNQLISRKIIRPEDHNSNGKVKSFKVHDMILEYIVSKSSEENFITVVGGHWLMPTPSNKVRRLSMQSSGSKDGNSTKGMNLSQVRSLTVFGSQKGRLPFHSFNNGIIQVLDLEGWQGMTHKYLNDICEMLALKYLSLRRTEVAMIPSKIGMLEYLETLDIRDTRVEVLPRVFGRLKRLRSMLGGSKNKNPKALKFPLVKNKKPMKALRVLSGIEINEDSIAVRSLDQMPGLRKLAIYKLNILEGGPTFKQLRSSIESLCSGGLQTLAINDEGSDFINSLDSMSTPPRYLVGLELSGKIEKAPKWIKGLNNLYKLTLSVTVLRTDTFKLIKNLPKLFSLTFTLTAEKDDRDIVDILEENKLLTDREIIVPPGGFESLKLLRFFATLVPRLSFAVTEEEVMPALERIDMRFQAFEGIYGIETLKSLQELHLSVGSRADKVTKFLVEELKDRPKYLDKEYASKWPKIISD